MIKNNPIGLFDSGIGGTSIWKEINKLLPLESTICLADSKNAPYGLKRKEEIIALSKKNTEFLLHKNCKLIVVACNTATTNAIKELRAAYDVPFIGIEPAIKTAATSTQTHKIGILATKGTLNSELFNTTAASFTNVEIIEQIGYGLVQLIEKSDLDTPEMINLLKSYLNPMIEQNIDYLVLGCSHYPYLIPQIKKIIPSKIKIIDSGEAVAKQTKNILIQHNLLCLNNNNISNIFYSNVNSEVLKTILDKQHTIIEQDF